MLAGTEEATVVCGHTHLQVDRRVGRWRIVNAGSVGFPERRGRCATGRILGPDVELRQLDYDRQAAYDEFKRTDWYASDRGNFLVENLLKPPTRSDGRSTSSTRATPRASRGA